MAIERDQRGETTAVRIRLGSDRPAQSADPLGRRRIGYAEGLGVDDLWERGRGVWKANLSSVAKAELALLVANAQVVCVARIEGVTFHHNGIAILGRPFTAGHWLEGQPDPFPNASLNPLAYGSLT